MKNCKLFGIIVLVAVISLGACSSPAGGGGGGAGSTGIPDKSWYDPGASSFIIKTPDELAGLAELVNVDGYNFSGKTVTLGANINLTAYASGEGWIPISNISCSFLGTFDGGNYTISNLKIDRISEDYQGLFSRVGDGAGDGYVKKVKLTNVDIKGNSNVGGITGRFFSGSITDSSVTGTIYGDSVNVGGIAGRVGGTIERCYSTADVTGYTCAGGITGQISTSAGKVMNCYSSGDITALSNCAGGIAGHIDTGSSVENCYATGNVTGNDYVGGIAGLVNGSVTDCAALGNVVTVADPNTYYGRVAGSNTGSMNTNVACTVRIFQGSSEVMSLLSVGPTTKHGETLSIPDLNASGTIGGRFTTGNGWTTSNGSLPGFGAVVPMPSNLKP